VVGVVLAGGAGRRMGGGKAGRLLGGRPLASYPADALATVCERVAIVAKPGTELPELPGVERWDDEPAEPRHPLAGIVHALRRADGPVLVCAADMPFVTAEDLRAIARSGRDAVAVSEGRLQPVLAHYTPAALPVLTAAAPDEPLTRTVERLEPIRVAVPPRRARGIDTPEQLAAAEVELTGESPRRASRPPPSRR
jgi:molybdopterin-guanine dinucleotide biosynthesis protein A